MNVMDDWAPSVALSKVSFASNYFYDVGMGFPKISMLAFYWGIFPANRPTLRKAVYAVTAYVCTAYFVVLWDGHVLLRRPSLRAVVSGRRRLQRVLRTSSVPLQLRHEPVVIHVR
jgi:hypothetical protein